MAFAREKQEQYLSQTVVIQCYFSSKWCCHGWSLETLTQKPGEEFDLQDLINFKRKALVVAPNHITPDRSRAAFLLHSKWFCLRAHSYPECLGPRSMLLLLLLLVLLLLLLLFHQCPVELPFAWWQSRIFMDLATKQNRCCVLITGTYSRVQGLDMLWRKIRHELMPRRPTTNNMWR